ncbi:hypothetical protein Anas_13520 [Armadillidium nasatum]|uniref:Uncharacterized protein n=1 Tax=Armadillidium nasatum TaxID=96803 RepID=A0A5N5TF18_9CRUS|nr:hypothetical protein Anas_13520 [Armadillidium nasatum]
MDINREVMESSLNVCDEVQEKDTKDNPPSTSQENFQIKQEFEIKEEVVDIPDSEDFVSECEDVKRLDLCGQCVNETGHHSGHDSSYMNLTIN